MTTPLLERVFDPFDLVDLRELPADEPDDDANEVCHIVCMCRPHFTFCGIYDVGDEVDGYVGDVADELICVSCDDVGDTTGCPACGCRNNSLCQDCLA